MLRLRRSLMIVHQYEKVNDLSFLNLLGIGFIPDSILGLVINISYIEYSINKTFTLIVITRFVL